MKIWEVFDMAADEMYKNSPVFIAGVECEIESRPRMKAGKSLSPYFACVEDGSLRNNGREFISLPLDKETLLTSFDHLQADLTFDNAQEAFSPRTSTHVHINCLNMELEEIKNLLLLYALFEDFFFMMTENRRDNIHCVPLTETYLPEKYSRPIDYLIGNWHKYTALNLLPLRTQGTVEFRHLHGTGNSQTFKKWVDTLSNLWELSRKVTLTDKTLVDEAIITWWKFIFKDSPEILQYQAVVPSVIKNSLLDVKLAFI